jgi:hypothetical protein
MIGYSAVKREVKKGENGQTDRQKQGIEEEQKEGRNSYKFGKGRKRIKTEVVQT